MKTVKFTKMSLNYIASPWGLTDKSAFVQGMDWRLIGANPLPDQMLTQILQCHMAPPGYNGPLTLFVHTTENLAG